MKIAAPAHNNAKTNFILTVRAQLSGRRRENHLTSAGIKVG
jgi:hypothetical protein